MFETDTYCITTSKLLLSGAVEFGSRALGISTRNSDYDFAILRVNYETLLGEEEYLELPPDKYFKVVPPGGKSSLVAGIPLKEGTTLDLLVVEKKEYLDIIKEAIKYMKSTYRKDILKYKNLRIDLCEAELLHRGFIKTGNTFK